MQRKKTTQHAVIIVILTILAIAFIMPILIVLVNSFKSKFIIQDQPFALPDAESFVGIDNYASGINLTNFFSAFGYSLFITVFSVLVIVVFDAMTAWFITRSKTKYSSFLYYLLIASMVVPFQMVMFPMSKISNMLHIDNQFGIILLYLGFGSGMSVFLYSGFVKSIPIDIEEASLIDGCSPIQEFFKIVFPILKPITVTVAILNTMWVWNDYLMPYLVIGTKYRTIPIAVQYLEGGFGSTDIGAMMAVLILAVIPVIIFYFCSQKYIIKGIVAGAVKG